MGLWCISSQCFMNILFYTTYKVSPTKGGTERTTISVATGLIQSYGCKCYSVYSINDDKTLKEKCFDDELLWDKKDGKDRLRRFIISHKIQWIIDQGEFNLIKEFKDAAKGTGCRVALAHHFQPGWEEHFIRWSSFYDSWRKSKSLLQCIKYTLILIFFPLYRWKYLSHLPQIYREAYELADLVVLLSKSFISEYVEYGKLTEEKKFQIIPNGLSYNEFLPLVKMKEKKCVSVIVSRLDDSPKRISLALRVWNEVKKREESHGWLLKIIGYGRDEKMYRKLIKELNIPDVSLLGRQQPQPYYEEASIFLMTSKSEGWGLTLTEAQQFGVVPIAFNSYPSLTDIITDGEDGIIIPECDVEMYINRLAQIMGDRILREQMAVKCINNCQRFSQNEIAKKWWSVLNA